MGVNLTKELGEAKDVTVKFLGIFAIEYSKMYLIALMKQAKKQIAKEAAGPQWVLLKCCKAPPPQVLKTGVVKKLSKYLKKWNPRYMIARGDYLVDYYESEEKFKAGAKPLGTINMSNKHLNRDANDSLLNRLLAIAEKCGMNTNDIPKPERFPDYTMEIWHEQKGPILLQCPDEAEWISWCDVFDKCRWHAPRYNEYTDKCHVFAFPNALWRTRWECHMWGWWYGGGGEAAMLVDAINQKIADDILGPLERRLKVPWAVRQKVRDQFIKTVDGIVTTAVGPAWKVAYEGVKKIRPTAEAKVKENMQPIVDAQLKLQDEISKQVEAKSRDFLNEKVLPHLGPLLDIVFAPVIDGFRLIVRAFDVALERGKERYETKEDRLYMVWHHNYNSEYWDAERKIWDLYEPLWALRQVFDDIQPWSITGRCRRRLRKTLDNALFTFENLLEDGRASGLSWDEAAAQTRQRLAKDCQTAIMRVLGHLLFGVVENFFEKLVVRPARKIVKKLADAIPAAIKDFVDPEDLLTELLFALLRNTCNTLIAPYATKIDLGIEIAPDCVVTRSAAAPVAVATAPAPQAQQEQAAAPAAAPEQQQQQQPAAQTNEAEEAERKAAAEELERQAAAAAAAAAAEEAAAAEREAERRRIEADVAAKAAEEAAAAARAAEREAEEARQAEEARRAAEDERLTEEERKAEEARTAAEAARDAEAAERAAAAAAREEEERRAEEQRRAEEAARVEAERRAAEEAAFAAEVAAAEAAEAQKKAREAEAAALEAERKEEEARHEAAAAAAESERTAHVDPMDGVSAEAKEEEESKEAATAQEDHQEDAASSHRRVEDVDDEKGVELIYFPLPGRAKPIRLMLQIGGVPFKDTRLSFAEYGALMGTGALPLDTLPVLKMDGRVAASQSGAILRLAAELADLNLTSPLDILRGEDLAGTTGDLAELWSKWFRADSAEAKNKLAEELILEGFPFYARRIEQILSEGSDSPFVADALSYADILTYCVVGYCVDTANAHGHPNPVAAFPRLSQLMEAVGSIPAVQEYK